MLFSIVIFDEPDTANLRDLHRNAHLDYLKKFEGQTLFAGPFTTDDESSELGSLRIIEFPDLESAEKHIAAEPYVIAGIQKRWIINRWRAAVPTTWRNCPREKDNIQALFHGLDGPDGANIRKKHLDDHKAYLAKHASSLIARGPILDKSEADPAGSLFLLDVPDMEAAHVFIANEPYNKSGCFQDVIFRRWRFGRVFDRFKI